MNSRTTQAFRKAYRHLPSDIQKTARQAYQRWQVDPHYQSLDFKQIHPQKPFYSVRVGIHWRVVGIKTGKTISWFWIGPHAEYDHLVAHL